MPFVQGQEPDRRCIWIEGPVNAGKTTSLGTAKRKVGIISPPDEKGHPSIPYFLGDDLLAYIWKDDGTPLKDRNTLYYMRMWREVEEQTTELIHTPGLSTIVVDGVHKLYGLGLAIATDGESKRLQSAFKEVQTERGKRLEGEFDPRCYGKSHQLIWEYVNMVASSNVPWRVFTSWSEYEMDEAGDTSRNGPRHQLPDLPGKAARRVLGEVSVVLHALIDPKGEYVWQTKPGGKVWGAGVKGNIEFVKTIPTFIPQDFTVLEQYLYPNGGIK